MKRITLVSTTLLLLGFLTHAQTTAPNDARVKDGVYYNLFFNISFTYPKDWVVYDQEVNDRIHERSKEEAAKTGGVAQWKHTYPLLSVTRHPRGTPDIALNPFVFVVAEKIDYWPGNPGAKEYLLSLRESKAKRRQEPTLKEPVEFRVAGFQFLRDDYHGEVNGVPFRKSVFVTVKKGYALIFSFTGEDEKRIAEMAQSMNTILPLGRGGNIGSSSTPERKPDFKNQ